MYLKAPAEAFRHNIQQVSETLRATKNGIAGVVLLKAYDVMLESTHTVWAAAACPVLPVLHNYNKVQQYRLK